MKHFEWFYSEYFGYDHQDKKSSAELDTIKNLVELVGWNKLTLRYENAQICIDKSHPDQMLDLNASAKGMGVDIVADFIQSKNIDGKLVMKILLSFT